MVFNNISNVFNGSSDLPPPQVSIEFRQPRPTKEKKMPICPDDFNKNQYFRSFSVISALSGQPLPNLSANVSFCLTPPPPFFSQC